MSKLMAENLKFAPDAKVSFARGTGTDVAQAITLHKVMGDITSSTANLGADTSETISLTNRHIKANSMVMAMVSGGGTGVPVVSKVLPAAGSCTFLVRNINAGTACDAVYRIRFLVIGDQSQEP